MSKTYLHKEKALFKNKLISKESVSINLKLQWNRKNFDIGKFTYLRFKKLKNETNT